MYEPEGYRHLTHVVFSSWKVNILYVAIVKNLALCGLECSKSDDSENYWFFIFIIESAVVKVWSVILICSVQQIL